MPFFSSSGLNLHYIDETPDQPKHPRPILLVHGFASSIRVNWVGTGWVSHLRNQGYRVIAIDNRGHGQSDKPHDKADYTSTLMAEDAANLLKFLKVESADVMGYSMGARNCAFLALDHPQLVCRLILGGLGSNLIQPESFYDLIADGLEAPSGEGLKDTIQRRFRAFAEAYGNDLLALAACMRGSRQTFSEAQLAKLQQPTLICVGTRDDIAGDPSILAELMPNARVFDIQGRDHNLAVGDLTYKAKVSAFLAES